MSSKDKIEDYWRKHAFSDFLHIAKEDEHETCFACGAIAITDRAHILARSCKGSNKNSNLHLLCKVCHAESEYLDGINYWAWIILKSTLYTNGTIVPLYQDTDYRGETVFFPMFGDFENKLKDNIEEYSHYRLLADSKIRDSKKIIEHANDKFSTFCKMVGAEEPILSEFDILESLWFKLLGYNMSAKYGHHLTQILSIDEYHNKEE